MTVQQRSYLAWMFAATATACAISSAAVAQDRSSAGASYGSGVHAYFALSSAEAEQHLTQAMQEDPDDPRPYYFRSLCLLRQGRGDEARSDMMFGAALEAREPGRYPVGKSLERVQGGDRLVLEGYRRQARQAHAIQRGERSRAQFGQTAVTDAEVLRQKVSVPLDQLVQPGTLADWTRGPAGLQMPKQPAPLADSQDRGGPDADATPGDPFADDPFADADGAANDQPEGKVPSGKLLGILGRVLRRTAPLPSLEGLREQLPALPVPGTASATPDADAAFGSETGAVPDEDADPFAEPASGPDDANGSSEEASPADSPEEDPFGGF